MNPSDPRPASEEALLAQMSWIRRLAHRLVVDQELAEDLVQEAFLRWQRVEHEAVRNPQAWLVTAVTRLAIRTSKTSALPARFRLTSCCCATLDFSSTCLKR